MGIEEQYANLEQEIIDDEALTEQERTSLLNDLYREANDIMKG